MPIFQPEKLKQVSTQVFLAAGATADESRIVSDALRERQSSPDMIRMA
jgi:hypothetical protein